MRSLLVLLALSLATPACLGAKESWQAQTITSADVRVSPVEVYRRKDRLFVRVTYTNLSPETVTVDRDAMALQLPDGRVIPRSLGSTSTHTVYSVPPNGAHAIFVDFRDEGLEKEHSATVLWKGAVHAGTREVEVPPTPVTVR
jgi:hypothetical protein